MKNSQEEIILHLVRDAWDVFIFKYFQFHTHQNSEFFKQSINSHRQENMILKISPGVSNLNITPGVFISHFRVSEHD